MADRCTTLRLDLRDLARAADDPKLAALLAEGWQVIAHIAVAEDEGAPSLVLVLSPPAPAAPRPVPDPAPPPPSISEWQRGVLVGSFPMLLALAFVAVWAVFR